MDITLRDAEAALAGIVSAVVVSLLVLPVCLLIVFVFTMPMKVLFRRGSRHRFMSWDRVTSMSVFLATIAALALMIVSFASTDPRMSADRTRFAHVASVSFAVGMFGVLAWRRHRNRNFERYE